MLQIRTTLSFVFGFGTLGLVTAACSSSSSPITNDSACDAYANAILDQEVKCGSIKGVSSDERAATVSRFRTVCAEALAAAGTGLTADFLNGCANAIGNDASCTSAVPQCVTPAGSEASVRIGRSMSEHALRDRRRDFGRRRRNDRCHVRRLCSHHRRRTTVRRRRHVRARRSMFERRLRKANVNERRNGRDRIGLPTRRRLRDAESLRFHAGNVRGSRRYRRIVLHRRRLLERFDLHRRPTMRSAGGERRQLRRR